MKMNFSKLALALALVSSASAVLAASDTANLSVGATVQTSCAIGPGSLSFGNVTLAVNAGAGTTGSTDAADADSATSVEVVCTNGSSATIKGGNGQNHDELAGRRMTDGTNFLPYQLYTTSGRSVVLDEGTGSIPYTGTGTSESVTVYGRIEGSDIATAKKGVYADVVALTVNYDL